MAQVLQLLGIISGNMFKLAAALAVIAPLAQFVAGQSAEWGQCGGIGWNGATTCQSPWTCTRLNDWVSLTLYLFWCMYGIDVMSSAVLSMPMSHTVAVGQTL